MVEKKQPGLPAPGTAAVQFAEAVESALCDLEERVPFGMGPLEQAEAARIREAVARLQECVALLAGEELMIRGSTGQRRAHPLLKVEQDLRREISSSLKELTFRAEQRAMVERLNALTRRPASGGDGEGSKP